MPVAVVMVVVVEGGGGVARDGRVGPEQRDPDAERRTGLSSALGRGVWIVTCFVCFVFGGCLEGAGGVGSGCLFLEAFSGRVLLVCRVPLCPIFS